MKKICLGFLLAWLGCVASGFGTTFGVNNNFDDGSNSVVAHTIRWAINNANTWSGGPHVVSISAGSNSITVCADLWVKAPMSIFGNGNTVGAISSDMEVFNVIGNVCTFSNLVIRDGSIGIELEGNVNQVSACLITNAGQAGIYSSGVQNTIGGTSDADRNYIVGNPFYGILAQTGSGLTVKRNYIGVNPDGSMNGNYTGIGLDSTQQCLIGGTLADGNVISGSSNNGIEILNAANGNTICGNIIGLNPSRTTIYGNGVGIMVTASPGNWLGLPQANSYNVIAGNTFEGIYLSGNTTSRCENTVIQNNYIGVSAAGGAFSNYRGIVLGGTDSCLIGGNRGTGSYEKNIISANSYRGISLSASNGNTIIGNYIGTNIAGTAAMGNGIGISVSGNNNLIGGANLSAGNQRGNVIAGSTTDGIDLYGAGNSVVGNYLGLTADGNGPLPNTNYGLRLDAFGCLVGGKDATQKNIFGDTAYLTGSATGNTMVGNWHYVYANGSLNNFSGGVNPGILFDSNAMGNWVGLKNGSGNLIASANSGIKLSGPGAVNNGLFGNTICSSVDPTSGNLIDANGGAENSKHYPAILAANAGVVSGHSNQAGDYIEVFKADRGAGWPGGSLVYLGSAVTDGSLNWSTSVAGLANGDYVCALASDSNNNTSWFSFNFRYGPPYTPTTTVSPTVSPTSTISPTITPSPTISPTFTISPTLTASPTKTPTMTATLTASPTTTNSLAGVNGILAFPNPGKKQVKFVLHLDQAAEAKIDIYNINGELSAKLTASLHAGQGQVMTWDCSQAGAGVYVAKIFLGDKLEKTLKVAVVH